MMCICDWGGIFTAICKTNTRNHSMLEIIYFSSLERIKEHFNIFIMNKRVDSNSLITQRVLGQNEDTIAAISEYCLTSYGYYFIIFTLSCS